MNEQIRKLFTDRDKAVAENNRKLFLSTQIGYIKDAGADGYLSVDKMKTEIVYSLEINKLLMRMVAKECYYSGNRITHCELIIYDVIHTIDGWKISRITY